MDNGDWTNSVSLRFFSEVLSPDELAAALNVQPDETHRKGEPCTLRRGAVVHRRNNALYLHSGLPEDRPLDEHVAVVLKKFEEVSKAVQALACQITMDVHCELTSRGHWRGLVLSPAIMTALSDRGLQLGLVLELPQHPSDVRKCRDV